MARSDLSPALIERLQKAFMAVNQHPQKDYVLKSIKKSVTGFAPATDRDYEKLRELMKFAETL